MHGRRSYTWMIVTGIAALLALTTLGFLIGGPEASDFEETTGVRWTDLMANQPEVANYISHLLALLGVAGIGIAAFGGSIAITALRFGERWSWLVLWILPLTYFGFVVVFLRFGFPSLAGYYGTLAIVLSAALGLSARRYLWSS